MGDGFSFMPGCGIQNARAEVLVRSLTVDCPEGMIVSWPKRKNQVRKLCPARL